MKTIKLLAFTLIAATTFSVAACKKDDSANDSLKPYGTVDDVTETKVEGTLHNVTIKETTTVFVKNKSTEYKVVVGESADAAKAGAFITSHVYKATGAQMVVVKESEVSWNEQNKNIYVGCKNLFAEAGLTMPSEDLRESGYYIKSKGDSVFIATNFNAGYQTGALAFLRATIGYDMLSADCVVYEKDGATMPDIEIIERPDFDFRHYSQPLTSDGLYGMGFSSGDGMISIDGRTSHTSFSWLPPSKYSHDYSEWYADNGQQLCYTAHGDSERFEQMVDTITKNITKRLDEYPDINTVSISQQDTADYCTCWKCREVLDKYGTMNGTIIPFLNRVSDEIQAYYKSKAEDTGEEERQITVISFAYQYTSDPPVKRNANGKWEPIDDTVVMRDNVGIYIAPLEAKYNQTFYDEANRGFYDNITRWGLITKHVYFWLYETNFCAYMYPYNTWDTMIEQYRFIAQYGQNYIFNEGQLGQYGTTAFTRFKDYIDSKAQFDVNVDYAKLKDRYFKLYFGEAEEPMRELFDSIQTHMGYIETVYGNEISGGIYDNIENVKYWDKRTIDGYMDLIDQAEKKIERLKTTDPERYTMLHDHITLESLFPRYVLCTLHEGMFTVSELYILRSEFKADCLKYGVYYNNFHLDEYLSDKYTKWGV